MTISILHETGQAWKMHATTAILIVSIGVMISAAFSGLHLFFVGIALGAVGIAFCSLAIRCPRCGARWYWRQFKAHGYGTRMGWARELLRETACPSCSYNGHNGA